MIDRQNRLIEVYDYLRDNCGVHTKTQFAEKLGYGRTSLSAAMNGKMDYLTDSLFQNICNRWPGIFNLDYLLTGDGTLLSDVGLNPTTSYETVSKPDQEPINNTVSSAVLAAKEETIASLRREIEAKDQLINLLKEENERFKFERRYYDSIQDLPNMASEDSLPYRK